MFDREKTDNNQFGVGGIYSLWFKLALLKKNSSPWDSIYEISL